MPVRTPLASTTRRRTLAWSMSQAVIHQKMIEVAKLTATKTTVPSPLGTNARTPPTTAKKASRVAIHRSPRALFATSEPSGRRHARR
jgi:hypothetical protein